MTKAFIFAAGIFLGVPQTVLADEYFVVPPSGQTETLFEAGVADTTDKLASKCIDQGWTVISTTDTMVVCEAPMNFGQSLLGTILMGNSYSTPPRSFYRFNVANVQGMSRVQASGWTELQMAFGQMRRTDFSGAPFHNGAMNFMGAAGGLLPPGTTFPNHVIVGVDLDEVYSKQGVRVSSVKAGGPGEVAGIQAGDMINRLAGKKINSSADWFDGAAKAARTENYEVEFTRSGRKQKVTVTRAFRPPVEAVAPKNADEITEGELPQSQSVSGITMQQALSPADELAKFAKLRNDGIISEEEFAAQKAKLLGAE
jgi:hypothetical protein